eukprot:9301565-Pyramimonas_sp.AAC.1
MARLGGGIRKSLGLDAGGTEAKRARGDDLNPDAQLVSHRIDGFAMRKFKQGHLSAPDVEEMRALAGGPAESGQ